MIKLTFSGPQEIHEPLGNLHFGANSLHLVGRAFEGSTSQLVAHLLDQARPSAQELAEIRQAIEQYQQQRGQ